MKNYILKIVTLLLAMNLVACLDDKKYALDPSGTDNVIEFIDPQVPNSPAGSIYPSWVEAFPVAASATFERTVRYSGPNSNSKDIEVEIAVDPIALDEYNSQMINDLGGATFELLPDDHYDISSLTLTIPKGEREAKFTVTIYPGVFDLSKKYALPIRIVSASSGTLSARWSVGIFGVVVKNKYDAAYTCDLLMTGWAAYGIQSGGPFVEYPGPIGLVTTGPNTNGLANLYAGTNLLPGFTATLGATQFGAASPLFTFDANDKLVGVTNALPDDGRGRTFVINPAATPAENVFDPETRSIDINIIFKQNGRPDNITQMYLTFDSER